MRVLDRTSELAALREIAARGPPAFLVVCGRRRVGKSCLRDHVWHDRRVFCYLSANAPAEFNQRELLRDLADGAGREFVARDYPTWQAGFRIGATAEEVVQETWLGVLRGLERCAALVAQDTWLFRILLNRAKTRAQREDRTIPFSAHWDRATAPDEPAVAPERFLPADHPRWPHHWASRPRDWGDTPEERFLSQETRACLDAAIAVLPPSQREVIVLRDIEGWTAAEACHLLAISETNQRVLLHRARSKVRQALEYHLEEGMGAA